MDEIWKPIAGFEGLYEVSNLGQVRNCHDGRRKRILKLRKRILGQFAIHNGRMEVELIKNGKVYKRKTHLLVAQAFLDTPPKGKLLVTQKDGDYSNNKADNLCYISAKENFHLYWFSPRAKGHWKKRQP